MKAKLIKDFSKNSYVYKNASADEHNELGINLQFTGYEELGTLYRLERQDFESFMLTYMEKGSFSLTYDNKYYSVPQDSLLFIDCMKPHEVWTNNPCTISYIHIYSPLVSEFYKYITNLAGNVISLEKDKIGFLETVKQIHQLFEKDVYDKNKASCLAYELLLNLKSFVENGANKIQSAPDYINNLIEYISKNYTEDLRIENLAKITNFTPNYLDSLFKKWTGESLAKYVTLYRLKLSKKLLLTTDKYLYEIANEVGFCDVKALIRCFKKYFNLTPLQFKLQQRNNKTDPPLFFK